MKYTDYENYTDWGQSELIEEIIRLNKIIIEMSKEQNV